MNKSIILALPVYNEEKILEKSVLILDKYLNNLELNYKIIIVNNGSTDNTKKIAESLISKNIRVINLDSKGRGGALKYVWSNNYADIYSYCDIDLATDINYLPNLFSQIDEGYNIVVGSRYIDSSISNRTTKRLITSVIYIKMVRMLFKTKISDFQCGFKAIDNKIIKEILPLVKDNGWFFDTELILIAEKDKEIKIKEIPIRWNEMREKESRVDIIQTGLIYIKSLLKLRKRL